jgi:uncharacterized protein YjbI with pentapeptide repeats
MIIGQHGGAMANPDHVAKLLKGVQVWNAWRRSRPKIKPDLSGAELASGKFPGIDLVEADLERANLRNADLSMAGLREAHIYGADLESATLINANLSEANLDKASLKGVVAERANFCRASLREANLREARLDESHLREVRLSGADLRSASLVDCTFVEAGLDNARLSGADLREAFFLGANLTGADLGTTLLGGATFNRVTLVDAVFGGTVFGDNDLSTVKGLETATHRRASAVDIATFYRSKGKIPEVFLRGCGVPDDFLAYAKSLTTNPIEFYSCFISYSTKDQDFADRLYADLQNKGVRCWFAPHDVQGGKKLHEQIDEAIRLHDKLLLILSPYSMESEWVKTEIAKARKREVRDQRRVLFPIRLAPFETLRDWECFDADAGKDSAREIREYFIPDFSNWKNHDSYQEAFQRLISDLKASDFKSKTAV